MDAEKCPIDDCTSTVNFKSAQALKGHLQVIHEIEDKAVLKSHTYARTAHFPPQRCPYKTCKHPTIFKGKRRLAIHLEKNHSILKEDAEACMTFN
jgi:hypothetical protein